MRVHVTVTDVDDELARFERRWYRFAVSENQPGGTLVGRVTATDHDLEPAYNRFHYQFDTTPGEHSTNDSGGKFPELNLGVFSIFAQTGTPRKGGPSSPPRPEDVGQQRHIFRLVGASLWRVATFKVQLRRVRQLSGPRWQKTALPRGPAFPLPLNLPVKFKLSYIWSVDSRENS